MTLLTVGGNQNRDGVILGALVSLVATRARQLPKAMRQHSSESYTTNTTKSCSYFPHYIWMNRAFNGSGKYAYFCPTCLRFSFALKRKDL